MASCTINTTAISMRQSDAFLADTYTTHLDVHMNIVTFHILFTPTGVSHLEEIEGNNLLND